MVSYYGTDTPLQQVASISVPEARMIQIQPWDRGLIKEIEKAINKSDIGINPNNDGQVIRLIFPELTEERRKELSKDIRKKGEEAKVAVRNIRRDAMEKLKRAEKAGELTEDDLKQNEEDAQKLTDDFIKKIDAAVAEKTKEVMKV
jgi:ribosome recycling factor